MDKLQAIVVLDIDGVVRDVGGSYRQAIIDTVAHYTGDRYYPTMADIDQLKSEGIWNNDWKASQELIYRYQRTHNPDHGEERVNYDELVAFFQSRYRGTDPEQFNGYITQEPLLMSEDYFKNLTAANMAWGFFSGATRGSAEYVLTGRLALENPVLVAMEDAPSKPDPAGLFLALEQIYPNYLQEKIPVFYVGDTVADIQTIREAKKIHGDYPWVAIGVLPPHVQANITRQTIYGQQLMDAGATAILDGAEQLTPAQIHHILGR